MHENWNTVESDFSKSMQVWLENLTRLTTSTPNNTAPPRVLFILDNDYGELTTILYLILGQNCFAASKLLLSQRLYKHNQNILENRIECWSDEQELIQYIDSYQPDIVVLASGYLIPVHNLLRSDALERVCRFATEKQATIITADPFLGMISQWSEAGLDKIISIDIPTNSSEDLAVVKRMADKKLHTELAAANKVLDNYLHLYPTYTNMRGINVAPSDSKNKSFFNQKLLIPESLLSAPPDHKPHWVFIISEVDFQTQCMHLGPANFSAIVLEKLMQGASLGRKIIFLGPGTLINLLRTKMTSENEDIHLFNFGAFERVMALLLTAEYSFYWNVVSHTILIQLWNGKPVILFDRGHLARAIPAMYDRIIAWYYQGWEPQYFDHTAPLNLDSLSKFVSNHAEKRRELMESYQQALTPEMLLNSLTAVKEPL